MRTARLMMLVAIVVLFALGCSPNSAPDAGDGDQSEFDALVAQADDAFASGDAKAAFDLYTQALALPDAADSDGAIKQKQDHAKSLFVARRLLEQDDGGLDPKNYVTILVEHADAETETVEAERRIVAFLQGRADAVRRDIPGLRSAIEAEEPFDIPTSIYMTDAMTDTWATSFARLSGDFGAQTGAAAGLLGRAAAEAMKVEDRRWVEECVADLRKAEATLDELDAALEAMRSSL